ncbi:MAG: hypothetical protein K6F50_04745, partial [Kiritimatiellae bacterium]|nr:hypothetical protein [Kiritimatiellia bacterium]
HSLTNLPFREGLSGKPGKTAYGRRKKRPQSYTSSGQPIRHGDCELIYADLSQLWQLIGFLAGQSPIKIDNVAKSGMECHKDSFPKIAKVSQRAGRHAWYM